MKIAAVAAQVLHTDGAGSFTVRNVVEPLALVVVPVVRTAGRDLSLVDANGRAVAAESDRWIETVGIGTADTGLGPAQRRAGQWHWTARFASFEPVPATAEALVLITVAISDGMWFSVQRHGTLGARSPVTPAGVVRSDSRAAVATALRQRPLAELADNTLVRTR